VSSPVRSSVKAPKAVDSSASLFTSLLAGDYLITRHIYDYITNYAGNKQRSCKIMKMKMFATLDRAKPDTRLGKRQMISRPVSLGVKPLLGPKAKFLLLSDSCGLVDVGRPL
jgi:hypothetical protein